MGRREGPWLEDMDGGKRLYNLHCNGGVFNLGHRHPAVIAELDVSNLVQWLQAQVIAQYNELVGSGLSQAEIASRIKESLSALTDRQIEDMARASTAGSFNAGRNVAIVELKPQLNPYAVRSEVNDANTCDPCAGLDGQKFLIGSPEYLENQPPRKCEGKQRCRGFMVVHARV